MKLSYGCGPNISTSICRGNAKMPKTNRNTEPLNSNCIRKENCLFKGRSQIESVVYKVEILNPSSNSNKRNDIKKKCMWVQRKVFSNKDITILKVASHMKYIDIKLICPTKYGKSKRNLV